MTVEEALALGVQQQQAGRLEIAEQIYRIILSEAPEQADALHLLGTVAYQTGRLEMAIEMIGRAVERDPEMPLFYLNLGNALQAAGRLGEAEQSFRGALARMPAFAPAHYNLGNTLKLLGRLQEAIASYERAVDLEPSHADALSNLGAALEQYGKIGEAVEAYQRALAVKPDAAETWSNLGIALSRLGRREEAAGAYRRAIELKPDFAEAYSNLGVALEQQSKPEEAEQAQRRAIGLKPDYAAAWSNLGALLLAAGRIAEAIEACQKAISLQADDARAHFNLANGLRQQEKLDDAAAAYERALALDPANPLSGVGLGIVLKDKGKLEESIACLERTIGLDPECAEAYSNLAVALELNGQPEAARAAYGCALELKPKSAIARLGLVMAQVPILYTHPEQIAERRAAYREGLLALRDYYAAAGAEERVAAAAAVGFRQPFFLAYQGENDRELQQIFGGLMCELMAARYPQWAEKPPMPPRAPGEPIRVGIVSGFFHHHSVWKIPIKGWVEQLDKRRFTLFGYHTRARHDAQTEIAARSFQCFLQGPLPVEFWCEVIRNDRLHVLLFPDIGMEPVSLQLAALRLAPVQAVSLGHPETTGLPTMDYFLSSDLMEPANAQEYYTEKLVRLPNLSIYYTPLEMPEVERSRADFQLREDAVVYWCCQSLFKYLPQYDEVFPRIAQRVRGSQFVFIRHKQEPVNRVFRERMERAFAGRGLAWEEHVRILEAMPAPEFKAVARLSDVFLDSLGWSGFNSALESIAAGLPVVTLPGRTMRSRHSAAVLRRMGMEETIAGSEAEYVDLAARLGESAVFRARMAEQVRWSRDRLYCDPAPIAALEAFLTGVAQ